MFPERNVASKLPKFIKFGESKLNEVALNRIELSDKINITRPLFFFRTLLLSSGVEE